MSKCIALLQTLLPGQLKPPGEWAGQPGLVKVLHWSSTLHLLPRRSSVRHSAVHCHDGSDEGTLIPTQWGINKTQQVTWSTSWPHTLCVYVLSFTWGCLGDDEWTLGVEYAYSYWHFSVRVEQFDAHLISVYTEKYFFIDYHTLCECLELWIEYCVFILNCILYWCLFMRVRHLFDRI